MSRCGLLAEVLSDEAVQANSQVALSFRHVRYAGGGTQRAQQAWQRRQSVRAPDGAPVRKSKQYLTSQNMSSSSTAE